MSLPRPKNLIRPFVHGLHAYVPGEQPKIPGLIKLNVSDKPATAEHPGTNPFTKLPTIIKAKPARKVVKARPVKALKDAV